METTTDRINLALSEAYEMVGKYESVCGKTPAEHIAELFQVEIDLQDPEYHYIFSDYSDSYKDMHCSRPRPYIPPTIAEMKRHFESYAEHVRYENEQYELERAEEARLKALIKPSFEAGSASIGDILSSELEWLSEEPCFL